MNQIDNMLPGFTSSWQQQDTSALLSFCADNVLVLNEFGEPVVGEENLERNFNRYVVHGGKDTYFSDPHECQLI